MNEISVISERVDTDIEMAKNIANHIRQHSKETIAILFGNNDGKAMLCLMIGDSISNQKSIDASALIKHVSKEIQGGGGGSKLLATAGGKNPEGLEKAVQMIHDIIKAL